MLAYLLCLLTCLLALFARLLAYSRTRLLTCLLTCLLACLLCLLAGLPVAGDGSKSGGGRGAAESRGRAGGNGDQGRDARTRAECSGGRKGGAPGAPARRFGGPVVVSLAWAARFFQPQPHRCFVFFGTKISQRQKKHHCCLPVFDGTD